MISATTLLSLLPSLIAATELSCPALPPMVVASSTFIYTLPTPLTYTPGVLATLNSSAFLIFPSNTLQLPPFAGTAVAPNSGSSATPVESIHYTQDLSPTSGNPVATTRTAYSTQTLAGQSDTTELPTAVNLVPTVAASSPAYLIGSQILSAEGPAVTYLGTAYSLESGGSSIVAGSSTYPVSAFLDASTPPTSGMLVASAGGEASNQTAGQTASTVQENIPSETADTLVLSTGGAAITRSSLVVCGISTLFWAMVEVF